MEHFVEFEDVCKYYQTGSVKIAAADHLNFYVDKGEFCIIVGHEYELEEKIRKNGRPTLRILGIEDGAPRSTNRH